MSNIPATEFKAKCLALMDRVAERQESFVITKRGRPVAKLVPADPPQRSSVLGCMVGAMELAGDRLNPPWTEEQWKGFERERAAQARAWDREWRTRSTTSGKRTTGKVRAGRGKTTDR